MMGKFMDYPYIAYTNFITDFVYNPLIYFYCLSLTKPNFRINWKMMLHFFPALLMVFYYFNFFIAPVDKKLEIMQSGYNYFPSDVAAFSYATLFQGLIYLVLSASQLHKYGKRIKHFFSAIEKRNFNWIKIILIFNLIAAVFCFFLYRTHWYIFGQSVAIFSAILIYFIGYAMLSAPPHMPVATLALEAGDMDTGSPGSEIKIVSEEDQKYVRSGLSPEKSKKIALTITDFMAAKKPYLEPDLNLKQFADDLHLPVHHLSQVINQQFNKNFYDYINSYRVAEIKSRLADNKYDHLTLLAIAFECGFNSKATFNNVFKKSTGRSPSEFKKDLTAAKEMA